MKIEELRFGNKVFDIVGIITIDGIQPTHVWSTERSEPIYIGEILPIQLTEDLLHDNFEYSFQGQCWKIDLPIPNKYISVQPKSKAKDKQ
jgi:hypothetical protein